jgi:hypothetical protein
LASPACAAATPAEPKVNAATNIANILSLFISDGPIFRILEEAPQDVNVDLEGSPRER